MCPRFDLRSLGQNACIGATKLNARAWSQRAHANGNRQTSSRIQVNLDRILRSEEEKSMAKQPQNRLDPEEGPGRHSGRLHPKTETVKDAKELSPKRLKAARAQVVKIETRS